MIHIRKLFIKNPIKLSHLNNDELNKQVQLTIDMIENILLTKDVGFCYAKGMLIVPAEEMKETFLWKEIKRYKPYLRSESPGYWFSTKNKTIRVRILTNILLKLMKEVDKRNLRLTEESYRLITRQKVTNNQVDSPYVYVGFAHEEIQYTNSPELLEGSMERIISSDPSGDSEIQPVSPQE